MMGDGLVRATVAAQRTRGRAKPVHWRVERVPSQATFTPARACYPTIGTKSLLTTTPSDVTCSRCVLTNAFKAQQQEG